MRTPPVILHNASWQHERSDSLDSSGLIAIRSRIFDADIMTLQM